MSPGEGGFLFFYFSSFSCFEIAFGNRFSKHLLRLFPEVWAVYTALPCLSKSIHSYLHPAGDQRQSSLGAALGLPI